MISFRHDYPALIGCELYNGEIRPYVSLRGDASMDADKAYLMVRSQVANAADRQAFDHWYATQHVPMAMDRFRCEKAWRLWSRSDPSVYYALYQFPDMATLRARLDAPGFKELVADFDRAWPQVPRTRDLLEAVQAV
jgi:hypothetical protein